MFNVVQTSSARQPISHFEHTTESESYTLPIAPETWQCDSSAHHIISARSVKTLPTPNRSLLTTFEVMKGQKK